MADELDPKKQNKKMDETSDENMMGRAAEDEEEFEDTDEGDADDEADAEDLES
jgi:hypothetical protein